MEKEIAAIFNIHTGVITRISIGSYFLMYEVANKVLKTFFTGLISNRLGKTVRTGLRCNKMRQLSSVYETELEAVSQEYKDSVETRNSLREKISKIPEMDA